MKKDDDGARPLRGEVLHAAQPDVRKLAVAMARPRISVFPKCYVDELVAGRRNYIAWIHDAATLGGEGVEHYDEFFPSYDERDVAPVMDAMAATGQISSMMCFSPDFTHPDRDERRAAGRAAEARHRPDGPHGRPALPHAQRAEVSGALDRRRRRPRRRLHHALARVRRETRRGPLPREPLQGRPMALPGVRAAGRAVSSPCSTPLPDSPYFGVQYDPSNALVGGFDPIAFLRRSSIGS